MSFNKKFSLALWGVICACLLSFPLSAQIVPDLEDLGGRKAPVSNPLHPQAQPDLAPASFAVAPDAELETSWRFLPSLPGKEQEVVSWITGLFSWFRLI